MVAPGFAAKCVEWLLPAREPEVAESSRLEQAESRLVRSQAQYYEPCCARCVSYPGKSTPEEVFGDLSLNDAGVDGDRRHELAGFQEVDASDASTPSLAPAGPDPTRELRFNLRDMKVVPDGIACFLHEVMPCFTVSIIQPNRLTQDKRNWVFAARTMKKMRACPRLSHGRGSPTGEADRDQAPKKGAPREARVWPPIGKTL